MKTKIPLTDFKEDFAKRLRGNPKEMREYKKYILSEFEKDQNKELLLEGLKTIAMATEGMSKLAEKTRFSRRNLYKIFSKDGNPTITTFFQILKALDIKFKFAA
jgi:probable addiction module antidote protein